MPRRRGQLRIPVILVALIAASGESLAARQSGEWPRYRGPRGDGTATETELLLEWPASGPPELWRTALGKGYSGLSVSGGRVFTMFGDGAGEHLVAIDAASGEQIWRRRTGPLFRDGQGDGPRTTPAVHDGVVYALTSNAQLLAVEASTGGDIWRRDLSAEYRAAAPGWGISASPLLDGDRLLVQVGGRDGAAFAAFDRASGAELWRSQDDGAGYSTPIVVQVHGTRQAVFFARRRVVSLDPASGALLWAVPWKTSYDVNAASPLFVPPDKVFISSGYGVGSTLLRLLVDDGVAGVETAWRTKDMKNQFSSSVLVGDFIYGFDNSILECIEIRRGERMWRARGHGHGSLLYAAGKLIVLGDRGSLALAEATPSEYREIARSRVFSGKTWTAPSLAGGVLYLRDERELLALDLRPH